MNLPDFLTRDEKGGIRITGHRIDLCHIVELYHEGYSAEMMHREFPTLPPAVIYKVMAFYLENRADVDAYVAEVDARVQEHMAAAAPTPTLEELRARRRTRNPAPSP
jgi:uncharacterized protein (DUF433 family)